MRISDWSSDVCSSDLSESARAGDVERTRVAYLDRQALDAERRREQLAGERAGLDIAALAEAFTSIQAQHDQQKASPDGMGAEVESRKQAVTELQDQRSEEHTPELQSLMRISYA